MVQTSTSMLPKKTPDLSSLFSIELLRGTANGTTSSGTTELDTNHQLYIIPTPIVTRSAVQPEESEDTKSEHV
jgi:hypothetical protein